MYSAIKLLINRPEKRAISARSRTDSAILQPLLPHNYSNPHVYETRLHRTGKLETCSFATLLETNSMPTLCFARSRRQRNRKAQLLIWFYKNCDSNQQDKQPVHMQAINKLFLSFM